jgi:GT2 family glycosyltransferase
MKFSIVIPTCDRAEELRACLRLVTAQGLAEVIVTDDGRTVAGRAVAAESAGVKWIAGPRRGPAANRNHGAREAAGEWLIFLDDDCKPCGNWLAAYDAAASEGVDALEGCTECPEPDGFVFHEVVENLDGGAWWSCNMAVRREVFARLGGFDEDFTEACAEDLEFAWRMRKAGVRRAFVPGARVTHEARSLDLRGLVKRTAMHRWTLLYRQKTGITPAACCAASAVAELAVREYVDTLRMAAQVPRTRRWRAAAMSLAWRALSLPWFLPYYAYWLLRWRSRRAGGCGLSAR